MRPRGVDHVSLCNIDSWQSFTDSVIMFAPCATSGCTELPLFAHERCLRHVRCVAPRRGRWDPDSCKECAPLLKVFRKDTSAPSPLSGMWSIIRTYFKQVAKKAPFISDPKLQGLLEGKPKVVKRKSSQSSKASSDEPSSSATGLLSPSDNRASRDDTQESVGHNPDDEPPHKKSRSALMPRGADRSPPG